MSAGTSAVHCDNVFSRSWDLRQCIQIATWNVATLHRCGHQITLSCEMDPLDRSIAGLMEARLIDHGHYEVEEALLLYSGSPDHLHGVALLLQGEAKSPLITWTPVSLTAYCTS